MTPYRNIAINPGLGLAQSSDIVRNSLDFTIVHFGGHLRHLRTVLAHTVTEANELGCGVVGVLTTQTWVLGWNAAAIGAVATGTGGNLTVWNAASSPEALMVIFYGTVIVLPVIIGYTVFAYRVFWGKSTALKY